MRQKVAILYGGPSNEHEVSISSAKNIINNIDRDLYDVIEIFIPKNKICLFDNEEIVIEDLLPKLKNKCDIVFPVLHGAFGEDGSLQEILEKSEIPFVGSGSAASKIAIDKNTSNELFTKNDVSVPRSQVILNKDNEIEINFPVIVKPVNEGSSVGLFKFETKEEYLNSLDLVFKNHNEMLAQEFIAGREFTCGVIEIKSQDVALPVSEIVLKAGLFDYDAKYTPNLCDEITPAEIPDFMKEELQNTALKCHKILGCKSISRTDIIVTKDNRLYVLETNTLPGMTNTSFVPAQAKAYGLNMKELISLLLDSAKK